MAPNESPISEKLFTEIVRYFPNESPASIVEALNLYGVEVYERERERVQLAILKLSEGNLGQLWYYLDCAKRDYRDVLYWAEYSPSSSKSG